MRKPGRESLCGPRAGASTPIGNAGRRIDRKSSSGSCAAAAVKMVMGGGQSMDHVIAMQVFCRVADLGSYTAAADAMTLSNAAVTKCVQRLEARLGGKLIHRNTRRLSMTEAGKLYLEHCRRILQEIADVEAQIGLMNAKPFGKLRITASCAFGSQILAPILSDFMRRYPEVDIDCVLTDRFVNLHEEGFDLALRLASTLPDSALIARRISTLRQVVCGAPDYLARYGVPHTPTDLKEHRCIIYAPAQSPQIWRFTGPMGGISVKVGEGCHASDTLAARAALLAGRGISMLPAFVLDDEIRTGETIPVLGDVCPALALFAVYPSSHRRSKNITTFVDFVRARCDDPHFFPPANHA